MADIKLVIKIDEYVYKDLIQSGENTIHLGTLLDLRNSVRNGTPLKGHGRLTDADDLQEIRAELTKNYVDPNNRNAFRYTAVSLLDVLDLIDKHIKEYTE